MLHSRVSSDVLNQGWGSLPSSTVFVHQTSSVSSLAPCLVTGSSIRCPRRYKKPHRTQVQLSKFRLPFSNWLPKDTHRQFCSHSSCLSRRAGLSRGLFVTSPCPVQTSQRSWGISDCTTKSVGISRNLLKDWLKKGRTDPAVQRFYLTCKRSWDLTLGRCFFFPSVLYVYGITLMWLVEISWSSKRRELSKPSVETKPVSDSALLGTDIGILSSISHFIQKHSYLLPVVIFSSALQLGPRSSVVLCRAKSYSEWAFWKQLSGTERAIVMKIVRKRKAGAPKPLRLLWTSHKSKGSRTGPCARVPSYRCSYNSTQIPLSTF